MNPDLHSRLLTDIEAVRSSVAKASLAAVVYRCFALLQGGPDSVLARPLSAPMRQTAYLLGLALTRPEPPPESDLSRGEWDEINQRLERIYHAYFEMYLPGPDETPPENSEQWFRVRDVSMPAFLHFHTQGTLATAEQVAARVRAVFGPFDDQFQSRLGLSASVAVEMAAWAIDRVQRQADLMSGMMRMYRRHHEEWWDDARTRVEIAADPELQRLRDVSIREIPFAVYRDDLAARFGAQHANAFWEFLVTQERGKSDFTYPTEENPATRRPLFQVAAGAALCPVGNWLFDALYEGFHQAAEQCGLKKRALLRRDAVLEEQVAVTVRSLFGPAAEYFCEVFETPHSRHEHDLIVYWDRSLFVFEAKASPPVEPFRDPDRAFTRLVHAFRGDNGIQKAADQGGRVRRTLFESGVLRLYDQTGHLLREFPRDEVDEVFCVCVTADHHGPLATNLAFLLEKHAGDPYPWAVCVYDLEAFVGGLLRKGWGRDEFRRYLRERAPLHGKVFTDDELEIAGAFLLRGGLSEFGNVQADLVSVTPGFARVFDEIYMEPRSGRPPNLRMDTPVVLTDLRAELVRMASDRRPGPVPHRPQSVQARIGRNDPCPCRSGRKFKRCCGMNRG